MSGQYVISLPCLLNYSLTSAFYKDQWANMGMKTNSPAQTAYSNIIVKQLFCCWHEFHLFKVMSKAPSMTKTLLVWFVLTHCVPLSFFCLIGVFFIVCTCSHFRPWLVCLFLQFLYLIAKPSHNICIDYVLCNVFLFALVYFSTLARVFISVHGLFVFAASILTMIIGFAILNNALSLHACVLPLAQAYYIHKECSDYY